MVKFQEVKPDILNLSTGEFRDSTGKLLNKGSTIVDPLQEHKNDIQSIFAQEKAPKIEMVHKAIEKHPDINEEHKKSLMEYASSLVLDPIKQLVNKGMSRTYTITPKQNNDVQVENKLEKNNNNSNVINGIDISRYATDPEHEKKIGFIYSKIPDFKSPDEITKYMDERAPGNKLTGQLILNASNTYKVDPKLIIAIIYNDSLFGTTGLGKKTKNPGNVGNDDTGRKVKFKTWQDGINAVARTLSNYKQ